MSAPRRKPLRWYPPTTYNPSGNIVADLCQGDDLLVSVRRKKVMQGHIIRTVYYWQIGTETSAWLLTEDEAKEAGEAVIRERMGLPPKKQKKTAG